MNDQTTAQIRSIQNLGSVAIIASPVSLVFGGVLLSLVALICAIVGRSKLKALQASSDVDEGIMHTLRRQNTVGLGVSITALVINAVAFTMMSSVLMQAIQTGDYSQLTGMFGLDGSMLERATDVGNTDAATDVAENVAENISIWDKA